MCSSAAWDMKKAPDRFTARTLYQSSSAIFATGLSTVIPALLTRMSQTSVRLDDVVDGARAVVRRADVALVDRGGDADVLELALEHLGAILVATVAGGDAGALVGEAAADRRADPAGAASDERDPVLELVADDDFDLVTEFCGWHSLFLPSLVAIAALATAPMSGQISLRAFDPAINPMCPPGRSKLVTSSLETRSSSGFVPCGGAMWSAPAVTINRL